MLRHLLRHPMGWPLPSLLLGPPWLAAAQVLLLLDERTSRAMAFFEDHPGLTRVPGDLAAPLAAALAREGVLRELEVYLEHSDEPNAGVVSDARRARLLVSSALLELSDPVVEAVLAHEAAHMRLHHTRLVMLPHVLTLALLVALSLAWLARSAAAVLEAGLAAYDPLVGLAAASPGFLLVRACDVTSRTLRRRFELSADEHAARRGHREVLVGFLEDLERKEPPRSTRSRLERLVSTHPSPSARLERLRALTPAPSAPAPA